jgi:Fic family protein
MLAGVRGGDRTPGEFRTSQNWIGPEGSTLLTAKFVPPPKHEMERALDNLEKFLHEREVLPPLIHCGLAHAQFETIHPFLDGNGRVGRLLITFLLCEQKILSQPLLYLSLYLKAHRQEYYDRLMAVRTNGDWEGWLRFFLRGIEEVSASATTTAKAIIGMRDRHRALVSTKKASSAASLKLLDHMFEHPYLTVHAVLEPVGVSYVTANNLVKRFEELGLLKEMTGGQRNRRYRYEPYLALFGVPERPAKEQETSD